MNFYQFDQLMLIDFKRSALLEEAITKIRNKRTQPPEFRKNLRRIGRYLFYECGKNLQTVDKKVETPISVANTKSIKHDVVLISVLRASLPMVDAVFEELDTAQLGVVSASRGEMLDEEGKEFNIKSDYLKIPELEEKIAIIVDPMLATASTILFLLNEIKDQNPSKIVILCAIASKYGIERISDDFPNVEIYSGQVDEKLDKNGYIIPGLGDAGDRACNTPH